MSFKEKAEPERTSILTTVTVTTEKMRLLKGDYRGYITSLIADKGNAGDVFFGKNKENITVPMDATDVQVTRIDLDKLWCYSENGTEKIHIWAEEDIQRVKFIGGSPVRR